MKRKRTINFHIDTDSPKSLMRFWGIKKPNYTIGDLAEFYEIAIKRALELFKKRGIHVTFFCIGEEMEKCNSVRDVFKAAFDAGHELANHTYSHPDGLSGMDKKTIFSEIERCSEIIYDITGSKPAGFRSPGYDINNCIIRMLNDMGFKYDSSGFWSALSVLFRLYHKFGVSDKDVPFGFGESSWRLPGAPYYPSKDDWQNNAGNGGIVELPVARTQYMQLPFYSNFHIFAPKIYRDIAINLMKRDHVIYLMHLIEFVDLDDNIPDELKVHPNLKISVEKKLRILDDIIARITCKYDCVRTDSFVQTFAARNN